MTPVPEQATTRRMQAEGQGRAGGDRPVGRSLSASVGQPPSLEAERHAEASDTR
jgi:hypothetical protein